MLFFLSVTYMDNLTAIAVIFLCLFCLYLYYDNKKLNQIIEDLRERAKDRYEESIHKEDIMDINDLSQDINNVDKTITEVNKEVVSKEDETVNNEEAVDKDINNNISKEKNNNIKIIKIEANKNGNITNIDNNIKFDVEDFIKKDKYINRKLDSSEMNSEYLQKISRELESNMSPQTIKLTDYEQEQEDNAIISYKELLNVNNKKEETINDGTVEFIEELKKFRNNLGR